MRRTGGLSLHRRRSKRGGKSGQRLIRAGVELASFRAPYWLLGALTCLAIAEPAVGQRADENAVTAAEDAFGTSIGSQNVGLYSANDARGFSPQQAGNLRIEGLYFDQQTWVSGDCMVRETTMRVGIAAQSYSFPAPTGIADLSLRTPGDKALISTILTRGPFDSATADLETQIPLVERTLGVDLCAGYRANFDVDLFRESHTGVFGSTFRWRPLPGTEIIPFWSYVVGAARKIVPTVYTDGTQSLPLFRTQDLGTPDWTTWGWRQTTLGVVVRSALGDHWALAAGLFHSLERDPLVYDPYLTLMSQQTADSVMDVAPPFTAESTSGELRLSRAFTHSAHRQQLQLAVRGRAVEREFGGDSITDLGTVALQGPASLAQPALALGPASRDTTRQLDLGLTFEERWQGVGSFAVGVLADHYRRTVLTGSGTLDTDRTTPRLISLRAASDPGRELIFYSSFVQGLEDSAVAPSSAKNRYEPPPATRTWQVDGGIRWAPSARMQLIFGAFEIHKPYFNVDATNNVYTQLGRLQYRGLETSLSYTNDGLTVLVGGVRLQPRVTRVIPEPGATGDVPLGPVPLTLTANVDYAPPRWGPWAVSLQWNRLSPRVATTDNGINLPSLATLAAGVRYHWTLRSRPWTLRFDAFNLTDASGLHVSSLDVVLPEPRRRFMLTLATDQ
jgi:iron complex outermembrane receptor protein